jgi:intein/homing endonuclease
MPIHKTKNEDFFKTWTRDMAYVLGFFAADGSMYRTKRGGYYIDFEITDLALLRLIRNILESQNKISVRKRNVRWKTIYRLQIGSRHMFGDLAALGFTQSKSLILRFPPFIPPLYLSDFIRGYFDGDGCVHFGKYWRKDREEWKLQLSVNFTSGSKKFLEDLWSALRPVVHGGHITKKARGYELVFGQHDAVALFHFMYNNGSELFLRRKYQKFQFAFKKLSLRV